MSNRRNRRNVAVALGILLPLAALYPHSAAAAEGRTYYVDNREGSNCSDEHPGTSADAPWCGFTPANAHTYVPGDELLLARGAVFAEGLTVKGAGTAEAPVTVDAYGRGERPRIVKNSTETGLYLDNPSHVAVRSLDIGSTTDGRSDLRYGIRAGFTSSGHEGLTVEDVHVHDNRIAGMHIVNNGTYTITQPVLEGLRVSRVESSGNGHGIVTSTNKSASDLSDPRVPGKSGENAFTDVVMDRLDLHDDDNNSGTDTPTQVDAGCPDGLALGNVTDAVVTNSVLRNEASCRTTFGTAAIYLGNARNIRITNNMVTDTPNTKNPDMVAIDHESRTSQVTIQGNYFGNNFGGAIEYLAIHGADDFHAEGKISDNTFAQNGVQSHIPYPPDGAVAQLGDDIPVAAHLESNLYNEPFGFLTAKNGGDVSEFTQADNVPVDAGGDLHHAARDFGGPGKRGPWGYEARRGQRWKALEWDAERAAYAAGSTAVDRFTTDPGDTTAARTWTAPRDGLVTVRGVARPDLGEGTASVRLTLNGRTVDGSWQKAGEQGRSTRLDELRVDKGDVLRFEVAEGGAPVSWAPAVGYSAETEHDDPAGTWSYSVNGDSQDWTSDRTVTARRGKLEVKASGDSTELRTKGDLTPKDRSALRIRLDNDTEATEGTVTFTTAGGRTGAVPFHLNAHEPKGLATSYVDHLVELGDDPAWDGTVKDLSVKFTGAEGRVSVDRIAFDTPHAEAWDFTDGAEGWTFNPDESSPSAGRPVPDKDVVPGADNTEGTFTQHADIAGGAGRMQTFRATGGSLSRLDLWAYRKGDVTGPLYLRVVELEKGTTKTAKTLFTGSVAAQEVPAAGGLVSIHPNLQDLDPDATYGLQIFAPHQAAAKGTYGIGYNDSGSYPDGREYYTKSSNGLWHGPEAGSKRSLRFRTRAFAEGATSTPPDSGFVTAPTADGKVKGKSGYEPSLLSPDGLGLKADDHRYVRVRMNNPDKRSVGYLTFTTTGEPRFDIPGDGTPPTNEKGLKGIAFALNPGAEYTEYVLDMSTVPGWKGTVDQLKVQPFNRWTYYLNPNATSWNGAVDYVRVD